MSATIYDYTVSQPNGAPAGGWTDPSGDWTVSSNSIQRTVTSATWEPLPIYRAETFKNGKIVAVGGAYGAGYGQGVIGRCGPGLNYYFAYADGSNLYLFVVSGGATSAEIGSSPAFAMTSGHHYAYELICTSTDGMHTNVTFNIYDAASVYIDPLSSVVLTGVGGTPATPAATITVTGDTTGPQAAGGWGMNRAGSADAGWSRVVTRTSDNDAILASDGNLFFSPYNWDLATSPAWAQSQNAGAYIKTRFTGTSCSLILETSSFLAAATAANQYPIIWWSVDDGPVYSDAGVWSGAAQISSSSALLGLASGLAAGTHTLNLGIAATYGSLDRWINPTNVLRFRGLLVDSGAVSAAPVLRSKRILIFGDSITEGVRTRGKNTTADTIYNAFAADVLLSYGPAVGAALGCEYGIVGYGSQGYSVAGSANVPAHPSAWNYLHNGASRLVSGLLSPSPDYIVDTLGTNDGAASASTLAALIQTQLAAYRTAAPNAVILKEVPEGGFGRAGISTGYGAYRTTTSDTKCLLLDAGTDAQSGLMSLGSATFESYDGTHLSAMSHARKAAAIAQGLQGGVSIGPQDVASGVQAGLTSQGYTPTRGAYLDKIANLPVDPASQSGKFNLVDVDGIAASRWLKALVAFFGARNVATTDNGDGTTSLTFYAQDGSTPVLTQRFTRGTGSRSGGSGIA